jgi:hypothetical protein
MLFSRQKDVSSVTRNLSELDQFLLKELERLLDYNSGNAARKYHARLIIESLVGYLFDEHFLSKDFDELMSKRVAQNREKKEKNIKGEWQNTYDINKFMDRVKYLMFEVWIVPQHHQHSISFIWNECSTYGAHPDLSSDGGIAENVDSVILSIKPLLIWYYYNYRHFDKSDLKMESVNRQHKVD